MVRKFAHQKSDQYAAQMSNKRRSGNDDGCQDEGRKGCQVHGNIAEPEHAKVGDPAHGQDSHPPEQPPA